MAHPVDSMVGQELLHEAALVDGVDPARYDALGLFMRVADVMERWGKIYVVHVRLPYKVDGLSAWVGAVGPDPLTACMRAHVKSKTRASG